MISLKQKTISGIKWMVGASIAQRIISFAGTVVLARILSPADFGLFALAFVMIDAFQIFKSLGFDSALVRRKDDIGKACNTAFFLIPAMGMILFVILFFFAPLGAKFLNNPQVSPIIRTLAVIFIISTFGKVPQSILYRDMKFKYKSIAEVVSVLIYISSAVILAITKFGVWSLVIAYILRNLSQVSIEWYFSGWRPRFEFDKTIAWDMFHFGKYVLAGGIVWFVYTNLDNIVVGKLLGVTMLGYYAISRNIANFLNEYLINRVGLIMYPVYSKIQEDPEDVKSIMIRILKYISIVLVPFGVLIFLFAQDILRIVFGPKWLPATEILRIIAFAGIFRGLGSVIVPAFLAKGKSKIDFQISLIQAVIFFLLIVPLVLKFKLIGVGFAVLFSSMFGFMIALIRAKKTLHVSTTIILGSLKPSLIGSLLMFAAALVLKFLSPSQITNINFAISLSISTLIYIGFIRYFNKDIFKNLKQVFLLKT